MWHASARKCRIVTLVKRFIVIAFLSFERNVFAALLSDPNTFLGSTLGYQIGGEPEIGLSVRNEGGVAQRRAAARAGRRYWKRQRCVPLAQSARPVLSYITRLPSSCIRRVYGPVP